MEMVGFVYLFNYHNLTIGRSNDDVLCVLAREAAGRATKEVDQQCIYCSSECGYKDK
jgi:hypothetical protein